MADPSDAGEARLGRRLRHPLLPLVESPAARREALEDWGRKRR